MKTVTIYGVMSLAALVFAGTALADQTVANQNLAKRPAISQSASEQPQQPWVGASLKANQHSAQMVADQKQEFRKQLNLQYASKRSYVKPDSAE